MEVVSDATEKYDRGEKMDIYCKVGVSEYWIVDWRKKSVEIYMFDFKEDGTPYPYLFKTVTEQNKDELSLVMFPNFEASYDRLFDFAWWRGDRMPMVVHDIIISFANGVKKILGDDLKNAHRILVTSVMS